MTALPKVIDRYLAAMFVKIFVICWISLTGLFVMVDVFSNLEEFLDLGKQAGGLSAVLWDYYTPRVFDFFDRTAPLLALIAAIGTLVWMQRSNELVAVEAAGISKSRMVWPLVACMVLLTIASVANREWLIPQYKSSLARNAQSWDGNEARPLNPQQDQETGLWVVGGKITLAQKRIDNPEFQLPLAAQDFGRRVIAETATWSAAGEGHPVGFILKKVVDPVDATKRPSIQVAQRPLVISPSDSHWLAEDELFIACGVPLEDLAFGQDIQRYASLNQQILGLRNPSLWFSNRQRVQVHARIVRPALDLLILLIGIPVVLSRRDAQYLSGVWILLGCRHRHRIVCDRVPKPGRISNRHPRVA